MDSSLGGTCMNCEPGGWELFDLHPLAQCLKSGDAVAACKSVLASAVSHTCKHGRKHVCLLSTVSVFVFIRACLDRQTLSNLGGQFLGGCHSSNSVAYQCVFCCSTVYITQYYCTVYPDAAAVMLSAETVLVLLQVKKCQTCLLVDFISHSRPIMLP